jgi:ribonuclease R
MVIERDADDIARCFLLEQRLFEGGREQEFPGEVTGVISAGAFIAFGGGFDGMLPVRRLRGDWWELDETETALVGSRNSRGIRIGDEVVVQVVRVDKPRGRVDLSPVELSVRWPRRAPSARRRLATSRRTARRATATTSSTSSRREWC